jgi:hypothetical protein
MIIRTAEYTESGGFLVNKNVDANDCRQLSFQDDMANRHRRKLQVWIDAGNTPTPYVEPVKSYSELRQQEYPPMEDYLDGIVKGDQAQIDKYIADCLEIKQKHPKP